MYKLYRIFVRNVSTLAWCALAVSRENFLWQQTGKFTINIRRVICYRHTQRVTPYHLIIPAATENFRGTPAVTWASLYSYDLFNIFFKNFQIVKLLSHCDFRIHVFGCRCRRFELRKFPEITFGYLMFSFSLFQFWYPLFWCQYYDIYSLCFLCNVTDVIHIVCGTILRCLDSACSLTSCVKYRAIFKGIVSVPLLKLSSRDYYPWHYNFTYSHFVVQLSTVLFALLLSCVIIYLFSTLWYRRFSCP
jgi:hypothetical protein